MKHFLNFFAKSLRTYRSHKTTQILQNLDANKLEVAAKRELQSQYASLVKTVPVYQSLLTEQKTDLLKVDFNRFCELTPIIDKSIFDQFPLESFIKPTLADDIETYYTSSGSSGTTFSFNAQSRSGSKKLAPLLESRLDYLFKIHSRKSLIINCLPMGIAIPTESISVINCGTRDDAIIYLAKRLHGKYEQLIFIGEYLFLKKVIEGLDRRTTVLKNCVISMVTGAEYIPESYREYIGEMARFNFQNPDEGMLYFSMGASELSISIMFEDISTMKLRRYFHNNLPLLKHFLNDDSLSFVPHIMQYIPVQNFVEVSPNGEIIISNLNKSDPLQLLRYNTKDKGSIHSWKEIVIFLETQKNGLLKPNLKLPLCFLIGKQFASDDKGAFVNPNMIKAEVYAIPDAASKLTGNFKILNKSNPVRILFQLANGESLESKYRNQLEQNIRLQLPEKAEIILEFTPFHLFPYNMELNFQKKMIYTEK